MTDTLTIFGVRHHGPGSARSLLRALEQLKPDCVLIEGPPDANGMIRFVGREEMKPPVAILVHSVETPKDAVYYPFAEFSPEWQAMRWAIAAGAAVRFMDLPQSHALAIDAERRKKLLESLAKAKEAAAATSGDPQSKPSNDLADDAHAVAATPSAHFPVGTRFFHCAGGQRLRRRRRPRLLCRPNRQRPLLQFRR